MKIYEEDFKPVTLEDKAIFDEVYKKYPIYNSENAFSTLYCWMHYGNYHWQIVEGCLIIKSNAPEYTSYRAPIGPHNKEVLDGVIELSLSTGFENPFFVTEPDQIQYVRSVRPDLILTSDPNFAEYVYRADDLSYLPGKNYLMIRKQLNKYRGNFKTKVEPLTSDNMDEVKEFLSQWCHWRECDKYEILKEEKVSLLCAIDNFEALDFQGLAIRPEQDIGGISIFMELNPTTIDVRYEKGLPDYEGIYKVINNQTALFLKDRYPYINRESDIGLKGLREAKQRYHPDHMVNLYYLDTMRKNKLQKAMSEKILI